MATRQAHAPAESGEVSATQKTLPTSSGKPGEIFLHGIVFIPSGGNVGILPTGLSGGGGEGFGVSSEPSPVDNPPPPPPPPPTAQPQAPQSQPQAPPPQPVLPTRSAARPIQQQPSPTLAPPSPNKPSNDSPETIISSDGMALASENVGAGVPFSTNLPGSPPTSASSPCEGTDSCITVNGNTFSMSSTGFPSTGTSIESQADGATPSFGVLYPSFAPKGLDIIQDNPFRKSTLTIISICSVGYFFLAITSLVAIWIITRRRGHKRSLEHV